MKWVPVIWFLSFLQDEFGSHSVTGCFAAFLRREPDAHAFRLIKLKVCLRQWSMPESSRDEFHAKNIGRGQLLMSASKLRIAGA